jgi:dihydrofolate synthase/folylpolyglutamate synthase
MPKFHTLVDWLRWQETLHPRKIDLGLERVTEVAERIQVRQLPAQVITVAGTNGKGSTVTLLESILLSAGYHVGAYTSPHLLRYNERIRINGREVDDADLCKAFDVIESHRNPHSLTYFEFGTLAALWIMQQKQPDIVLLEAGLGGRLDAVNMVDTDIAIITSIGIDHERWLGSDRDSIAMEKAGILRAGKPAVCSDPAPPQSLREAAATAGADWYCLDEQFRFDRDGDIWDWSGPVTRHEALPLPALTGAHQLRNASGVLMAVELLRDRFPVERKALDQGLQNVVLPGRCQFLHGAREMVLDVAHNAQSAMQLAEVLEQNPTKGTTYAVLGMLQDKDVGEYTENLAAVVDHWCLAGLAGERGLQCGELLRRVSTGINRDRISCFPDVAAAVRYAIRASSAGDRIVICGSFHTVAEAMSCAV